MQELKTRSSARTLAGLESDTKFQQSLSSLASPEIQPTTMRGYRIDPQSFALPIWRRHHD
jgi:hypothetical protein